MVYHRTSNIAVLLPVSISPATVAGHGWLLAVLLTLPLCPAGHGWLVAVLLPVSISPATIASHVQICHHHMLNQLTSKGQLSIGSLAPKLYCHPCPVEHEYKARQTQTLHPGSITTPVQWSLSTRQGECKHSPVSSLFYVIRTSERWNRTNFYLSVSDPSCL